MTESAGSHGSEPGEDTADLLAGLADARREHGTVTVSCRFRCASSGEFDGRWRGVRLRDLLVSAPPETTHVRAVSGDGYRAPVALPDALDAVVATDRLDEPGEGLPRLVGEGLDSAETVRDLDRLEPIALPPEADPEPTAVDSTSSSASRERARENDSPEPSRPDRHDRHAMTDHNTTISTVPFASRSGVAAGPSTPDDPRTAITDERGESRL